MHTPAVVVLLLTAAILGAGENFRTDGGDEKLPWFQLTPGAFPPPNAAHVDDVTVYLLDPNLRTGKYRLSSQISDAYAKKIPFTLLPYATITLCGTRANWRDVTPRTHLRMHLFQNADRSDFGQVTACADDFSISVAEGWTWHIDEVKAGGSRIVASRQGTGVTDKSRVEFLVDVRTRIWKGRALAELKDLAVGQNVLINRMPGQVNTPVIHACADIWLDEESRTAATARQRAAFLYELKQRGLPGYVTAVDNQDAKITVTFFDVGDPALLKDLHVGKRAYIAVGFDNLMTCEPAGGQGGPDAMQSDVLSVTAVPALSGCGGVQVVLKPRFLLEGFRPARIVRVCPDGGGWNFTIVPPEERVMPGLWENRNERVKTE